MALAWGEALLGSDGATVGLAPRTVLRIVRFGTQTIEQ